MIRLVAMDVDGTLTDGGIYMDDAGGEFKRFHVRDGYGIEALMKSGVRVAFISGRASGATDRRARDLGVTLVVNGTGDKLTDLETMARELGVARSEVAFIGDDLRDVPCIEWSGLGVAVADAHDDVLSAADVITSARGGEGAVREVADRVLRANSAR
ncbi:MAG: HAD hydrolase family protein [Synergistaceae bacterium]|jgi:3-deoxy-D-manno-octulosonate 8-phosphate phosphatase (KDO 8-P phosphatase)|nr:HAD hydrolase family protein [Synergistaceae bacterium]